MGFNFFLIKEGASHAEANKLPVEKSEDEKFAHHTPPTFESLKTPDFNKFIEELEKQRNFLTEKAERLQQMDARISAERQSLEKLKKDVQSLQKEFDEKAKKFEQTRIAIDGEQSKNIKDLASTYATLSPQAAVSIIMELPDDFAVQILSRMKPEEIGPIFEEMTSSSEEMVKRAGRLSNMLRLLSPIK